MLGSDLAMSTLDKFQDIVEPFTSNAVYSVYVYLAAGVIFLGLLYGLYYHRSTRYWRQLKKIEAACYRGCNPRISLQQICEYLHEELAIPNKLQQEIDGYRFGAELPLKTDVSVVLVKLRPLILKRRHPKVSSCTESSSE